MLKTTLLLSFILVSEISAAQSNWLNLFDGSNLDQWRTYQCNCTTDGWVIVNNELVRKGPARDLITKEKFKEDVRKAKAMGFTKRVPFTGPKSGKPNGKLGVDYVAIERYDGLIQYYKKP